MNQRFIALGTAVAALALIGAGCKTSTTIQAGNKNISATISTNVGVNSAPTTGEFTTNSSVNTSTSNTNQAAKTATVTVTSSGVSPQTITVTSGTVVSFKNTDGTEHRVASNPHPSHTDLPGFDGSILPSATYTFTFTKLGTFGYHDHFDPTNTNFQGTITVQ